MDMIRILVGFLLAFAGVVALGPVYIGLLGRLGYGKRIRVEGPEGHLTKAGTPTMGGMLLIVVVMFLAMAMRIEDAYTLTPMLALVGVGILGAIDDFKIRIGEEPPPQRVEFGRRAAAEEDSKRHCSQATPRTERSLLPWTLAYCDGYIDC